MANLMFYENPIALSRETHKTARIGAVKDFRFAAKTNSVILTSTEFAEACKEYPIVFVRTGTAILPVALLGFRDNENLFVDGDGKWDARYIPAYVRRYPFVLSEAGGDQFTLCIDESSLAFNDPAGEALFDEEGKNLPILDNALNFVKLYQAEFKRTESFVKHLETLELLTEMSAKAELQDGRSFALNGLLVVNETKLKDLEKKKAYALLTTGELGLVYAHLISLSNMGRVSDRVAGRP